MKRINIKIIHRKKEHIKNSTKPKEGLLCSHDCSHTMPRRSSILAQEKESNRAIENDSKRI